MLWPAAGVIRLNIRLAGTAVRRKCGAPAEVREPALHLVIGTAPGLAAHGTKLRPEICCPEDADQEENIAEYSAALSRVRPEGAVYFRRLLGNSQNQPCWLHHYAHRGDSDDVARPPSLPMRLQSALLAPAKVERMLSEIRESREQHSELQGVRKQHGGLRYSEAEDCPQQDRPTSATYDERQADQCSSCRIGPSTGRAAVLRAVLRP